MKMPNRLLRKWEAAWTEISSKVRKPKRKMSRTTATRNTTLIAISWRNWNLSPVNLLNNQQSKQQIIIWIWWISLARVTSALWVVALKSNNSHSRISRWTSISIVLIRMRRHNKNQQMNFSVNPNLLRLNSSSSLSSQCSRIWWTFLVNRRRHRCSRAAATQWMMYLDKRINHWRQVEMCRLEMQTLFWEAFTPSNNHNQIHSTSHSSNSHNNNPNNNNNK